MPKTRTEFWREKFRKNVERDARNQRELQELGWKVIVLWECEIRREPGGVVTELAKTILTTDDTDSTDGRRVTAEGAEGRGRDGAFAYPLPSKGDVLRAAEVRRKAKYRARERGGGYTSGHPPARAPGSGGGNPQSPHSGRTAGPRARAGRRARARPGAPC